MLADLRQNKRKVGTYEEMKSKMEGAFENFDMHLKNVHYWECSAKTDDRVEEVRMAIAVYMLFAPPAPPWLAVVLLLTRWLCS